MNIKIFSLLLTKEDVNLVGKQRKWIVSFGNKYFYTAPSLFRLLIKLAKHWKNKKLIP